MHPSQKLHQVSASRPRLRAARADVETPLHQLNLYRIYRHLLDDDEDAVLGRIELGGCSYAAVGDELGLDRERVAKLVFHARLKLFHGTRATLEDLGEEPAA